MLYTIGVELPGQARLRQLVEASSQEDVARTVGAKQQAISRWIKGGTIPNAFYQQALEKAFGIPRGDWLTQTQKMALRAMERDQARTLGLKKALKKEHGEGTS